MIERCNLEWTHGLHLIQMLHVRVEIWSGWQLGVKLGDTPPLQRSFYDSSVRPWVRDDTSTEKKSRVELGWWQTTPPTYSWCTIQVLRHGWGRMKLDELFFGSQSERRRVGEVKIRVHFMGRSRVQWLSEALHPIQMWYNDSSVRTWVNGERGVN